MKVHRPCLTCGKEIPQTAKRAGVEGGGPGRPKDYCDKKCRDRGSVRIAFIKSEDQSAKRRAWRRANAIRLRKIKAAAALAAKVEGLKHYGGKCECCGEATLEFLTIEHKEGRAGELVRRTGKRAWQDLKRRGWPANITILCFNCNCAKGAFGICPHQRKR